MQLIDGKATAAAIKQEIKAEVEQIVAAGGKRLIWQPCSWGTMVEVKPTCATRSKRVRSAVLSLRSSVMRMT